MTKEEALQKLEFERKWLFDAGYNAYNIDIAFDSIRTIIKVLCGDENYERAEIENLLNAISEIAFNACECDKDSDNIIDMCDTIREKLGIKQ